jgi:hypothetical protein
LAAITESAVSALKDNEYGIPVLYDELPDILWKTVLPKIFGRPLTSTEISNIEAISRQYSKGRGSRHKEFNGDSEQKENAASPAVQQAAKTFLQESYDQLHQYRPKLLA